MKRYPKGYISHTEREEEKVYRINVDRQQLLFRLIRNIHPYHKQATGSLMSRITTDIPRIQYFIADFSQDIFYNLLMLTIMCGIMLHLN